MNKLASSAALGAAAIAALALGPALAQDGGGGAAAGAATGAVGGALVGGTVGSITDADRTYVRGYVVQNRGPSVKIEGPLVVGATLPQQVEVYPLEGKPGLANYRYA